MIDINEYRKRKGLDVPEPHTTSTTPTSPLKNSVKAQGIEEILDRPIPENLVRNVLSQDLRDLNR